MPGARQQQVGHIRARDEQHQADSAEDRQHHRPRVAHEIGPQRPHVDRPARRVGVVLLLPGARQAGQPLPRLIDRHAAGASRAMTSRYSLAAALRSALRRRERDRHPRLGQLRKRAATAP